MHHNVVHVIGNDALHDHNTMYHYQWQGRSVTTKITLLRQHQDNLSQTMKFVINAVGVALKCNTSVSRLVIVTSNTKILFLTMQAILGLEPTIV